MHLITNWRNVNIHHVGQSLLRIWLGVIMVNYSYPVVVGNGFHGFGDWLATLGIPLPHLMAYVAKGGEFIGGILLACGIITRLGAFLIMANMIVAVTVAGKGMIFSGAELAFCYLLVAMMIFLNAPDAWSVDHLIFKRQNNKTHE